MFRVPQSRQHGIAVLRFKDEHLQRLDGSLLEHAMNTNIEFHLRGFGTGSVSQALEALTKAGAWVGTSKVLVFQNSGSAASAALGCQLQQLLNSDLATCTMLGGSDSIATQWQLQSEAARWITIYACVGRLDAGVRLMQVRDEANINELTLWELVRSLELSGWVWRSAPKAIADRQDLAPVMLDCDSQPHPRVWYSPGVEQNASYMRCCLQSKAWLQSGRLEMLRHCQSKRYYTAIEGNTSNGSLSVMDYRKRLKGHELADAAGAEYQLEDDHGSLQPRVVRPQVWAMFSHKVHNPDIHEKRFVTRVCAVLQYYICVWYMYANVQFHRIQVCSSILVVWRIIIDFNRL